jgi:endonuclease/exonuclease/phosphatase (EEP) superfamily protein YafD
VLAWLYLALVLALWWLLATAGDRWWVATVLMFGPRWVWLLPLAVLALAPIVARRRAWLPVGLALVVVAGPIMGLCIPWPSLEGDNGPTFRVLSCNVHLGEMDPVALAGVLDEARPDVVILQEYRRAHEAVVFAHGDWHIQSGQALCLASRYPIVRAEIDEGPDFSRDRGRLARYELDTPAGTVHVVSLHLASPRDGLEEVIRQRGGPAPLLEANSRLRFRQSVDVARWIAPCRGPLLIAGDFNTPVESWIYQTLWARYTNAFSEAGFGYGNTHFTRRTRTRIDHILLGPGWRCRRCWVGPPVGSSHRPVLADVQWTGPIQQEEAR